MREKLIELLYHSGDECDQLCRTPQKGCHVCKYADCGAKCINVMEADYLIANGVTVRAKGEWQHIGDDEYCCIVCRNVIHTEGSWEKPTQKYCPNCGADMRGEHDGDSANHFP